MKNKYKHLLYLTLFCAAFFLGFKTYSAVKAHLIHEKISITDVQSIVIRGRDVRTAAPEEVIKIVDWFNSVKDIAENDFSGTTPSSSIEITLKSGKVIGILYPGKKGKDFEVQRYNGKGSWVSYWGNQPDIRKILENAD